MRLRTRAAAHRSERHNLLIMNRKQIFCECSMSEEIERDGMPW